MPGEMGMRTASLNDLTTNPKFTNASITLRLTPKRLSQFSEILYERARLEHFVGLS